MCDGLYQLGTIKDFFRNHLIKMRPSRTNVVNIRGVAFTPFADFGDEAAEYAGVFLVAEVTLA